MVAQGGAVGSRNNNSDSNSNSNNNNNNNNCLLYTSRCV